MNIAIMGAGNVGRALGSSAVRAGHAVILTSREPDAAAAAAVEIGAQELQAQLPHASVIKAFNTALAARQMEPIVGGIAIDGFVAGDDETAKKTVLDLVASMGFRPIDAGPLLFARTLEGMGWLNITLNMAGGTWQESWKLLGPDSIS